MGARIALANTLDSDVKSVIGSFLDDSSLHAAHGSDACDIDTLDSETWPNGPKYNQYFRNQRLQELFGLYSESMEFQTLAL